MIRAIRTFVAVFAATFAREMLPKPKPKPAEHEELPCSECDPHSFECPCLAARLGGIDGYNVEQLYRDIEELEHQE